MAQDDATLAVSSTSESSNRSASGLNKWLRVSALAAGSVLAGGLAVAWYYRKTLKTLQNADPPTSDSEFRIPDSETDFDI
jgi:hypothetical protein